jgi:hypothetical protein
MKPSNVSVYGDTVKGGKVEWCKLLNQMDVTSLALRILDLNDVPIQGNQVVKRSVLCAP